MSAHSSAEHHWEYSWAPFAAAFGIMFAVVLTFSAYFVYENALLAAIFAGVGVPLLLAGVAKWVDEGLDQKEIHFGYAEAALPIFIVSEIFIFLGLFVSYWMIHLKAPVWPPEGTPHINTVLPIIMTVLLITSSVTYHAAEVKHETGDMDGFKTWVIISIVLGVAFLGCTIYEYNHLLHWGFGPSTNAYGTSFFSITGFHASHVFIGMCIFVAVLLPAMGGRTNTTFIKCAGVYWHFVDLVWLFVASQVYYW